MFEPLSITFMISAFVAGVFTFLAPCTLPLVPAYLGFISGVSLRDSKNGVGRTHARRRVLFNGIAFVFGFTVVFILLGTLAGTLGAALGPIRVWASRFGGVVIILFGLFMLGALRVPALEKENRIKMPGWLRVGRPSSSFVVGAIFALGWSPCIGPILGSILLLASTSATVLQGTMLLCVFSFGLGVPFIALAALYEQIAKCNVNVSPLLKVVSFVGGVFLVVLGLLLISGDLSFLLGWGFNMLDGLNYEDSLSRFL